MKRRRFLTRVAGTAALCTFESLVGSGCSSSPTAPSSTTAGLLARNVRTFGARGDGSTDDTAAFAAAVRDLGTDGGTLAVPPGVYLINPLQSIVLGSGMHLDLAPGAVLQAIPVAPGQSAVVAIRNVADVRVTGGTIIGERARHLGTTGEWGFGIDVRGSANVTIEHVTVRECWGDGLYVGSGVAGESRRVTIRDCISVGHRRQGLSITACLSALVERCEFRGINGTVPECGVDLEPNQPYAVRDVTVRECICTGNAGGGILVQGDTTANCRIEGNQCSDNGNFGGIGFLFGPSGCEVRGNIVEWNRGAGILLVESSGNIVAGNTIRHNSQARSGHWPNVWLQRRSSANAVAANLFGDAGHTPGVYPSFDILVDADCDRNRVVGNLLRQRRIDGLGQAVGGVQNLNASTLVEDND
jgi:parallel beta-helix repeat protein